MYRLVKFIKTEKPDLEEAVPSNYPLKMPIVIKNEDDDEPGTSIEAAPVHAPKENTGKTISFKTYRKSQGKTDRQKIAGRKTNKDCTRKLNEKDNGSRKSKASVVVKSALMNQARTDQSEKPFKCDTCDKSFKIRSLLEYHQIRHSSHRPFQCQVCQMSFKSKIYLTKHKVVHLSKRSFKCNVCGSYYKSEDCLRTHMKRHRTEKNCKCSECNKDFKTVSELKRHEFVHSLDRPFKCDICNSFFKSKALLQKHQKITHCSDKPFKCEKCGMSFKTRGHLTTHTLTHLEDRQCQQCEHSFKSKRCLYKHKTAVHTKPFHCNICKRPFGCDQCDIAFKTSSALNKHVKGVHNNERPFKCTECDKAFRCGSHLKRHKLIHSYTKAYKCSKCRLCFISETSRQTHETSIHLNGKYCEACGKYYKNSLNHKCSSIDVKSILSFGKEGNYKCYICKTRFDSEYTMFRHEGKKCSLKKFKLRASRVVLKRLTPKQLAAFSVYTYPRVKIQIKEEPE